MPDNEWTITVAGGEGDTESVTINRHSHIRQLRNEGVRVLYGAGTNADDYDVLIEGVVADLEATLEEAGLANGSEVSILPKDVSRG